MVGPSFDQQRVVMSGINRRCKECMRYAKKALDAHAKAVGNEDEDLEIQVRDLLADLMHKESRY
jgi:hypothetical protein